MILAIFIVKFWDKFYSEKESCMNQLHRDRIWKMVIKGLADKTKLMNPEDNEHQTQVIDPDEIIKGFKESIQEIATD